MKIFLFILIIFFTKFSSAVTWEESKDHTLKFMRTVTSISAALHVCNKFDLSMRGLSIVNDTIELFLKQKIIDIDTAVDLKELVTLGNDEDIKYIKEKGISASECNSAEKEIFKYINQREDAENYVNSYESFDRNLVSITPVSFRKDCITYKITNDSDFSISNINILIRYYDEEGEIRDSEIKQYFNSKSDIIFPKTTKETNSCFHENRVSSHFWYLVKKSLISKENLLFIDQYMSHWIESLRFGKNENYISFKDEINFETQTKIKQSIFAQRKEFINKFTIDPIYKKSCISLKSSNKFDEDIIIKNYILIYKNEYGDMEDYEIFNYGKYSTEYRLKSKLTETTECNSSSKYKKFIKKLKKEKLINKKLEGVEKFIEVKLDEFKLGKNDIKVKNNSNLFEFIN